MLPSALSRLQLCKPQTPNHSAEEHQVLEDDIHIMDASLQFINELLRNMLDMQRAAHQQMNISMAPTDILRDVLEPVASILYLRGNKVEIITECPPNIVVESDRLRLKQVVLNLAVNSTKFVSKGFIRLRCVVVNVPEHEQQGGNECCRDDELASPSQAPTSVQIHLEDSGPGESTISIVIVILGIIPPG